MFQISFNKTVLKKDQKKDSGYIINLKLKSFN